MYCRNCHFALRERTPQHFVGEPDVLGIMPNRKLIEVEIKRSLSDFRANANKWQIANRHLFLPKAPYEFWFLVPVALVQKVKPELPLWAGLLSDAGATDKYPVTVEVKAMKNKDSLRLSTKECVALARCMANYVCALEKLIDSKKEHYEPELEMDGSAI